MEEVNNLRCHDLWADETDIELSDTTRRYTDKFAWVFQGSAVPTIQKSLTTA